MKTFPLLVVILFCNIAIYSCSDDEPVEKPAESKEDTSDGKSLESRLTDVICDEGSKIWVQTLETEDGQDILPAQRKDRFFITFYSDSTFRTGPISMLDSYYVPQGAYKISEDGQTIYFKVAGDSVVQPYYLFEVSQQTLSYGWSDGSYVVRFGPYDKPIVEQAPTSVINY